MTAHESEGEGVVVIVDLGGSYRLQNFVIKRIDRENVNSQLLIPILFIFHVENIKVQVRS